MKVLVTGNRGYIGVQLTKLLEDAGHEVSGLDTDLYYRCSFSAAGSVRDEPTIDKDIRDVLPADIEGFDAICHLAGLSNDPLGDLQPALTDDINHRATVHLAQIARGVGVQRFVFASSCSTYGAASNDDILDESAPFNPVTPYGRSKVDAENGLRTLATDDFHPTFLRCATAYGVSARLRFDLVVNNLVAWAFTTGKVHLKSDGSAWRPLVHIDDIARAYVAVLDAPAETIHNRPFNVGDSDENYKIREVAEIVADVVPNSHVEISAGASADSRCYRVNCDAIREALPNYVPEWTVRDGAEELYKIMASSGLTLEEFEGPVYQRIAHVRQLLDRGVLNHDLRFRNGSAEQAA